MISSNSLSILVFATVLSVGKTYSGWDVLVFSQSWPTTTCIEWKEGSPSHYCTLPKNRSHWNVHGLWPTAHGSTGPNFCKHVDLSESELAPIIDKMDEKWTNVQMPSEHYSFWRHEWQKHGSCAILDPELDSELKYFSKGLELQEKYDIAKILSDHHIVPDEKPYSYNDIVSAVRSVLNQTPEIHCVHEKGTGKILLSEIRVCLDDHFNLVNCVESQETCGSSGSMAEVIHYPAMVRELSYPTPSYQTPLPSHHWLYKVLYVLRLLMWFSP